MHIGATQRFSIDHLTSSRLHQRRAAQKNGALFLDDDGFIAHRRDIRAAGGARPHHHRDLRNVVRAQTCLVVENAAEVFLVGKHLVLQWQKRATGIDQVHARQVVLACHFLRAQMLFHRHREIGAAFDSGVIGDDHHFLTHHPANPADHAGGGRGIVIHALGGQRRNFQKR